MTIIDRIRGYQDELVAIRRDLHAHPEIGFEEERTSAIVAERPGWRKGRSPPVPFGASGRHPTPAPSSTPSRTPWIAW